MEAVGQEITKEIAGSKSTLRNVKVSYGCGRYPSHARVARVYRNIIRSQCNVVKEIDLADIVVLHFEPHTFASLFETYPVLERSMSSGIASGKPVNCPSRIGKRSARFRKFGHVRNTAWKSSQGTTLESSMCRTSSSAIRVIRKPTANTFGAPFPTIQAISISSW